jgi:hypothetical protein
MPQATRLNRVQGASKAVRGRFDRWQAEPLVGKAAKRPKGDLEAGDRASRFTRHAAAADTYAIQCPRKVCVAWLKCIT